MNNTDRISRLATKLHWATAFVLFALPLALFWQLVGTGLNKAEFASFYEVDIVSANLTDLQVWACVALDGLVIIAVIYTLEQMRRLFSRFSRGRIFDFTTSDIIIKVGIGFLAIVSVATVIYTIQVLILTWTNPPGEKALSIVFDDSDVGFLLSAGLLMIIGWAMRDAASLAAENQEFI